MGRHLTLFVFAVAVLVPAQLAAQVEIRLYPSATLETDAVRLGDIADIRGANDDTHQTMSELDLGLLPKGGDSMDIRASRVAIRLRLSGFSSGTFRVTGADTTTISRRFPQPVTDSSIEESALLTLVDALGVEDKSDLRVRLNTPMMTSLPRTIQEDSSLRAEVLPPLTSRIGTVSLTVRLFRGPRLILSRSGRFEVFQKQRVAITRTSLPRSHVIEARDVQFANRFLAAAADQLDETQVIGRQVRTSIAAGKILALRDLKPQTAARSKQLINVRDNVHVTAVRGRLRVNLTAAEAMQGGRKGDVIKVRNLQSQKIITGRVTAPGKVEIRL